MDKQLIIAEKPSVGQAIAEVLGVTEEKPGYMENDRFIVSWAFGRNFLGYATRAKPKVERMVS